MNKSGNLREIIELIEFVKLIELIYYRVNRVKRVNKVNRINRVYKDIVLRISNNSVKLIFWFIQDSILKFKNTFLQYPSILNPSLSFYILLY